MPKANRRRRAVVATNNEIRFNFLGKTLWITGGKRIGQAICRALADSGANLIISYRSSRKEAETASAYARRRGVQTLMIQCDVGDESSVARVVPLIQNQFKRIDGLILLASIFEPRPLAEITSEDWQKNHNSHLLGTFWPIQKALPILKPGSHIVAIADRTSIGRSYPGYVTYEVSKAAVAALVKNAALELGEKGIVINAIGPGPVWRPPDMPKEQWEELRKQSIVNLPITDEEAVQQFVNLTLFLCTVRSAGSTYPLDLGHL